MGLHFYLNTGEVRCFYEDLPRDTLALIKYEASELGKGVSEYINNPNLVIELTIDETFDNDHRVVQQKGGSKGEFTFTSLDSGEHKFCVRPRHNGRSWIDSTVRTRVLLDLIIGEAEDFMESKKVSTLNGLQDRIENLNSMLKEIERHQQTIREKETEFSETSQLVNFNTIKWTLIQIAGLIVLGLLQMRYLRNYFRKEKLV